jgi:hypothetical protein
MLLCAETRTLVLHKGRKHFVHQDYVLITQRWWCFCHVVCPRHLRAITKSLWEVVPSLPVLWVFLWILFSNIRYFRLTWIDHRFIEESWLVIGLPLGHTFGVSC